MADSRVLTIFVAADRKVVAAMNTRDGLVYVECSTISTRREMGPFGDEREARAFVFGLVEQNFGLVTEIRRG